jgi:hypothetical protein
MSARAVLSGDLKTVEIDMPYHERQGASKLRIFKDGVRFLRVILEAALLYRPSRLLVLLGIACFALAVGLMTTPVLYYLQNRAVAEWMIYRFVVSSLAGTTACLLFCTSYLSTRILGITLRVKPEDRKSQRPLAAFFSSRYFWLAPSVLIITGGALVLPSILERVTTGATYEHWSRYIAMSFFFSTAVILIVERILDYSLHLISERLSYQKPESDRRPA